jgi:hypothetical protein
LIPLKEYARKLTQEYSSQPKIIAASSHDTAVLLRLYDFHIPAVPTLPNHFQE